MTPSPPSREPDARRERRRVRRVVVTIAVVTGLLIWIAVFDLWLGQVERQYLWEEAKQELHRGPGAGLKGMMAQGAYDGVIVATGWMALVVVAILGAAWYADRGARRQ